MKTIKEQITNIRKETGLTELTDGASDQDQAKGKDRYREVLGVTLATVFDKFLQEFFPADDENGNTDEQVKQAMDEFVLLLKEIAKNPTLFARSLKIARRKRAAGKVIGKTFSRVMK